MEVKREKRSNWGGHWYPSVEAEQGTSDCVRGCGAWLGPFRSGAPPGIDPNGECPKNPVTALGEINPVGDSPVDAQAQRIVELLHERDQLRARYVEQCRIIEEKRGEIQALSKHTRRLVDDAGRQGRSIQAGVDDAIARKLQEALDLPQIVWDWASSWELCPEALEALAAVVPVPDKVGIDVVEQGSSCEPVHGPFSVMAEPTDHGPVVSPAKPTYDCRGAEGQGGPLDLATPGCATAGEIVEALNKQHPDHSFYTVPSVTGDGESISYKRNESGTDSTAEVTGADDNDPELPTESCGCDAPARGLLLWPPGGPKTHQIFECLACGWKWRRPVPGLGPREEGVLHVDGDDEEWGAVGPDPIEEGDR